MKKGKQRQIPLSSKTIILLIILAVYDFLLIQALSPVLCTYKFCTNISDNFITFVFTSLPALVIILNIMIVILYKLFLKFIKAIIRSRKFLFILIPLFFVLLAIDVLILHNIFNPVPCLPPAFCAPINTQITLNEVELFLVAIFFCDLMIATIYAGMAKLIKMIFNRLHRQ